MNQNELRYLASEELRFSSDGDGRTISGRIPYNTRSTDLGGFFEIVAPGAFDDALKPGADVRFLNNHSTSDVLGRTKSGTLTLSGEASGLAFRCSLPDTTAGRDVAEMIRRQDVSSVSFGFRKIKDEWSKDASGNRLRTLQKVDLFEISSVSFPAYPDTSVALRSMPRELIQPIYASDDSLLALTIELLK